MGTIAREVAEHRDVPWTVLVIGGHSGVGKTTLARDIGLRTGSSWAQVDDLRLAAQRLTDPMTHSRLHFSFDEVRLSPEELRDGLVGVAEALVPGLDIVVANHVNTRAPIVLEGDGILPVFAARTTFDGLDVGGTVRSVFLVEPDEAAVLDSMRARGRGFGAFSEQVQRTKARVS